MIVAGVDIGSVTTKVVILQDKKILSQAISPTGTSPKLAAEKSLKRAQNVANLPSSNINCIVSTGYGRRAIEFGNKAITEIMACTQGARWLGSPGGNIGTIVDLGGQDTKVISLNDKEEVIDFVMNDKCAAGTGRFLEVMANVLGVKLENLGELSLKSTETIKINSTCTVFAESEVVSLIAQGKNREDIIAGIHASIAERIVGMIREVGEKEVIFFTGGGAKNIGMRKALEDKLGRRLYVPSHPQFVSALGAALIARDFCKDKF